MNRKFAVLATLLSTLSAVGSGLQAADSAFTRERKKEAEAYEARDFARAIESCKRMLALSKTLGQRSDALILMEDAASSGHMYDVSIKAMNECIELNKPHYKLGDAYLDLMYWRRGKDFAVTNRPQLALADFDMVAKGRKEPRNVVNLMRDYCFVHQQLKQYDKCIVDLTKALSLVDKILGERNTEINIARVRGEEIQMLYERAKFYALVGKTELSKEDKLKADKFTEAL